MTGYIIGVDHSAGTDHTAVTVGLPCGNGKVELWTQIIEGLITKPSFEQLYSSAMKTVQKLWERIEPILLDAAARQRTAIRATRRSARNHDNPKRRPHGRHDRIRRNR